MFIGHFAVGFAAKRIAPRTSLAILFVAVQLLDLLWPIFLLIGLEHVRIDPGNTPFTPLDFYDYPVSHGLLGAGALSVLFGLLFYAGKKSSRDAIVVGSLVFSHWILDFITHRADLPILGDSSPKVGLGLWYSVPGTLIVELGVFVAAVWIYLKATKPKSIWGTLSVVSLVIFFLAVYAVNFFGPPPPSTEMIAVAGNLMWLIVLWAWWVERTRVSVIS
jgi:hypothetical protein